MSFAQIAELNHGLLKLRQVDRLGGADSFFGRMEILEQLLEEAHREIGREGDYHRMNRYMNVISPAAFTLAVTRWKEAGCTLEELQAQSQFFVGHQTPDAALFHVLVEFEAPKIYGLKGPIKVEL